MMNKNIIKMYAYAFTSNLYFERSISIIYFLSLGWSLLQIGVIQSILNIVMALSEMPTGALGDRIGKKPLLIVGSILIIIYFFILIISNSFFIIVVAYILFGIGLSCISGTDESSIYEILDSNASSTYQKIIGTYNAILILSLSVSSVLGGKIQNFSWIYIFVLGILAQIISIILLSLVTNKNKTTSNVMQKTEAINFKFAIIEIKSFLSSNVQMIYLFIGAGLFQACLSIVSLFGQSLFNYINISTENIGIIYGITSISCFFASLYAYKVANSIGKKRTIIFSFFSILIMGLIFIFEIKIITVVSFLIMRPLAYICNSTLNAHIHNKIPNKIRVSLISFLSMICTFIMAIMSILIGFLEKYMSITLIFLLIIVISIIIVGLLLSRYAVIERLAVKRT